VPQVSNYEKIEAKNQAAKIWREKHPNYWRELRDKDPEHFRRRLTNNMRRYYHKHIDKMRAYHRDYHRRKVLERQKQIITKP
jgi:hypothetical protein